MSPGMLPKNKCTCLRKHFTSTACRVEKLNDREEGLILSLEVPSEADRRERRELTHP